MRGARLLPFILAWLGVLPSGCSDGGRADPERTADDPLCPLCRPTAGGDSSDFGGGSSGCSFDPPRALAATEVQALLDESPTLLSSFEAKLGWTKETEERREWREEPATEFPTALLRASVELAGEPEGIVLRPVDNGVSGCPDYYVRIPVRVSVEISDGTLRAELTGHLWRDSADLPWTLQAAGDLAHATGTLDLDLESDGVLPESGHVWAYWRYLDQYTGTLGISGLYRRRVPDPTYTPSLADAGDAGGCIDDAGPGCPGCVTRGPGDGGDADVGDGGCVPEPPPGFVDRLAPQTLGPTAHFPFGRCRGGTLAVEHDEPQDWLGGESVQAVFERARREINARAPVPAAWCYRGSTDVRVEIGALAPDSACRERSFAFSFLLDGRAQSADRELDESFELGSIAVLPESHQLETFAFGGAGAGLRLHAFHWDSDGQLTPRGNWVKWEKDYVQAECLQWSDHELDACRCEE
jgi:hypothetical protein